MQNNVIHLSNSQEIIYAASKYSDEEMWHRAHTVV